MAGAVGRRERAQRWKKYAKDTIAILKRTNSRHGLPSAAAVVVMVTLSHGVVRLFAHSHRA